MNQRLHDSQAALRGRPLLLLALTALGVVYGDIGTSPLYALRECFNGPFAVEATAPNIMGVLSLVWWSLLLVISVKYLTIVLRADNDGEGGILALMALAISSRNGKPGRAGQGLVIAFGIFAAGLLLGDGMITPAISVLSAVEGLEVATPLFAPYVVPMAVGILIALFLVQHRGTSRIGICFGPVMLVWFATLAVLGIVQITHHPQVLWAVNPLYAFDFFVNHRLGGLTILGLVFLVVTGGEALYADMGHFGPRPIRLGWYGVVFVALMLNYAGQGALLLSRPDAAVNPFYYMAPPWALYPLVALATAATVIASQALISGAFSLALQSVHLGYLPRMRIRHTSATLYGQIYVPAVNWLLMAGSISLVIGFRGSSALAAAYGVAVTATMLITDALVFVVMHRLWKWKLWACVPVTLFFSAIDLVFFGANAVKISQGGWIPLVIGGLLYLTMTTWRSGRMLLAQQMSQGDELQEFVRRIAGEAPPRVAGDAIFMTGDARIAPPGLVQSYRHFGVLHERVVILTVVTRSDNAHLSQYRLNLHELGHGFFRAVAYYGFMEEPDVTQLFPLFRDIMGLDMKMSSTTIFLGRESVFATERPGMALWREILFSFMVRNAQGATDYFNLPPERVMEVGRQILI